MDLKTELQNFKTINLEEITQGEVQISDNIRNSVFLYNKAIESLRSGSEDIAVIELKKATAMNPQFYEAMNLLGICYSYSGDKDKAAEVFNRVMKAESNSLLAMSYMQRLGLDETVQLQKNRPVKQNGEKPGEPLKRIRNDKTRTPVIRIKKQVLYSAVKIGAGLAAGLLISGIIFSSLPPKENGPTEPSQSTIDVAIDDMRAEYEEKYTQLENKYKLLQQDKESIAQQADYYKASLRLYEIDTLTREKKYEEAADMLLLMKTVEFRDAEKERFDGLYQSVMPQAAKAAYDQGYKLYNSRKYQDSLKKYEKVEIYDPEYKRMDAVLYYMGRCYQALQDSRSAVALYQKLTEGYPKSTYAKSASSRIKELTRIP